MAEVLVISIDELLRQLLAGEDPGVGGGALRIEEDSPEHLQQLLDAARRAGDSTRVRLLAPIGAFLQYSARRELGGGQREVDRIVALARNCGSAPLHSWIVGQIGSAIGWPDGIKFLEDAWGIAGAAGVQWAQCQWALNLANLWAQQDPDRALLWAGKSLELARSIGDTGRAGAALNTLSILTAAQQDSLSQARDYAAEALAIARQAGDRRRIAERSAHLAELSERLGLRDEAISLFSKALDGFRELRHPKTFDLIRHLAAVITDPFEQAAEPVLRSHLKKLNRSLDRSDIERLMEQAQRGQVVMASWDPRRQTTVFDPDPHFARDLGECGEWRALAVYARHWMEQGFPAGDPSGLYWLSISLRSLGLQDAAEATLEFGLRLHGFFEDYADRHRGKT